MTDVITLTGVSQRTETVTWLLLDQQLSVIGEVHPLESKAPSITNDSDRNIKRTISTFELAPTEAADINPLTDRIQPFWTFADGSSYPLGVFMFANNSRAIYSFGTVVAASGVDQTLLLDQPIERTIAFNTGQAISDAFTQVLAYTQVPTYDITSTSRTLGAPLSWQVGRTTYRQIINDLASLAGFFSLYFNNEGTLILEPSPAIDGVLADFDFDEPKVVVAESIVETDDLLDAPNRYIVVDSSVSTTTISGFYDIPASAPHSIANRGFVLPTVIDAQGLTSNDQAAEMAQARAASDTSTYLWADLETIADPRFDTFDVVQWQGVNWRSKSWSLPLEAGGIMKHQLRRQWQNV